MNPTLLTRRTALASAAACALPGPAGAQAVPWSSGPHPTASVEHKPDDAHLLDVFAGWIGNTATSKQILVDNPRTLYGFPPVTP